MLTPTLRYQPAVIAQAFATLGCLFPGRVFLGVGTGEAMNETPVTGDVWPGGKERRLRLAEAVRLIRALWTEERVDFEGEYYKTARATIYDRPDEPVPIYIAASGPLAAKLAGRVGDGFICTSGKGRDLYVELLGKVARGRREGRARPRRDPQHDRDQGLLRPRPRLRRGGVRLVGRARALAASRRPASRTRSRWSAWPTSNHDRASSRFIVSDDPDEVVERIAPYVELGFDELVFHFPGDDQARFLEQFARDVLPRLRAAF